MQRYAPVRSPTNAIRTPRQLVLAIRNCSEARHSQGQTSISSKRGTQISEVEKLANAQTVTHKNTTSR